jgi:hypothetical protein
MASLENDPQIIGWNLLDLAFGFSCAWPLLLKHNIYIVIRGSFVTRNNINKFFPRSSLLVAVLLLLLLLLLLEVMVWMDPVESPTNIEDSL